MFSFDGVFQTLYTTFTLCESLSQPIISGDYRGLWGFMIEIGSALDPGRRRIAKKNQDAICVVRPGSMNWPPPLLLVADGIGGYEGGAIASQLVASSFTEIYRQAHENTQPIETLRACVSGAIKAMRERAAQDASLSKMGSTVVAAILRDHSISLVNVGDSRAYLINKKQVWQISYDHSLVGEQLRQGFISEAELRVHPRRNILSMAISAQRMDVNEYAVEVVWKPGDRLVLCSDGLWGPVMEAQIQSVVMELDPQPAADRLVELANLNMGPDNIAVIVASNDLSAGEATGKQVR